MDLTSLATTPVDASIARGAARLRAGGHPTMLYHAIGLGYDSDWCRDLSMLGWAKRVIRQERAKAAQGHWAFSVSRLMAAHELRAALEG